MSISNRIAEFANLLENHTRNTYINRFGPDFGLDRLPIREIRDRESSCIVSVKPGKKYTKVDVGRSGKYMIDESGNILESRLTE